MRAHHLSAEIDRRVFSFVMRAMWGAVRNSVVVQRSIAKSLSTLPPMMSSSSSSSAFLSDLSAPSTPSSTGVVDGRDDSDDATMSPSAAPQSPRPVEPSQFSIRFAPYDAQHALMRTTMLDAALVPRGGSSTASASARSSLSPSVAAAQRSATLVVGNAKLLFKGIAKSFREFNEE